MSLPFDYMGFGFFFPYKKFNFSVVPVAKWVVFLEGFVLHETGTPSVPTVYVGVTRPWHSPSPASFKKLLPFKMINYPPLFLSATLPILSYTSFNLSSIDFHVRGSFCFPN